MEGGRRGHAGRRHDVAGAGQRLADRLDTVVSVVNEQDRQSRHVTWIGS